MNAPSLTNTILLLWKLTLLLTSTDVSLLEKLMLLLACLETHMLAWATRQWSNTPESGSMFKVSQQNRKTDDELNLIGIQLDYLSGYRVLWHHRPCVQRLADRTVFTSSRQLGLLLWQNVFNLSSLKGAVFSLISSVFCLKTLSLRFAE